MVQRHRHTGLTGDGEKISYNDLKDKPEISTSAAKTLIYTRAASVGTGVESFEGFGFVPTNYNITAWKDGFATNPAFSIGGYDGSTEEALNVQDTNSNTISKVLRVKETTSQTSGTHDSFTSDGIDIDFDNSDIDCILMITAYK